MEGQDDSLTSGCTHPARGNPIPGWVDTHAHLYEGVFAQDIEGVISRAKSAGIRAIVLPNCDTETLAPLMALARAYPGYCYPALGLHPTSVTPAWRLQMQPIMRAISGAACPVAVGEVGLDRYWSCELYSYQYEAFRFQLSWACKLGKPVLIHAREATDQVLDLLEETPFCSLRVVLHSFQGGAEQVERALRLPGLLFGLGGITTFKRGYPPGVLERIPPERVLLETDAPYLAPVPHRGERNEPAYIPLVAAHLADLWGIPLLEVSRITTGNAVRFFSHPHLLPAATPPG